MPKNVNDIMALLQQVSGNETSLDMLMEFEKTLDNANLYAYQNWMNGELVEGPEINRYWFITTWMYPEKMMPDPKGGLRLIKYGCKVSFAKDNFIEVQKVLGPEDLAPGQEQRKKAKERTVPVWLVTIKMPRKFVDDAYEGVLQLEDEEVDIEDINAAWDEDLEDGGTTENDVDETGDEDPRENQDMGGSDEQQGQF
jgi:hypothetical protein